MSGSKNTELYDLLGINPGATQDEIKTAFRKAALKHHPDKGGNEEMFKKISKANDILSDPERRREYDRFGIANDNDDDSGHGPGFGFNVPFDLGSVFNMFNMGGGPPGPQGPKRQKGAKAPPKIQKVQLSLSQFYHGHSFDLKFNRQKFCVGCKGNGYASKEQCSTCGGSGSIAQVIHMGPMVMNSIGPCHICSGEGQIGKDKCADCNGSCKSTEEKTLKVVVKPGSAVGEVIIFEEACSDTHEYAKPGDLHIVLEEAPDDEWKRSGANLETKITLNLAESLIGCIVKLTEHPSNEPVTVHIRSGTINADRLCFPGHGMPAGSGHGNLYVVVHVQPSQEERDKLQVEGRNYLASLFGTTVDKVIEV